MAHLLLQTNDHRTILDECDVELADIDDERLRADLLARLGRGIRDSERGRRRAQRRAGRIAAIRAVTDYRELSG